MDFQVEMYGPVLLQLGFEGKRFVALCTLLRLVRFFMLVPILKTAVDVTTVRAREDVFSGIVEGISMLL